MISTTTNPTMRDTGALIVMALPYRSDQGGLVSRSYLQRHSTVWRVVYGALLIVRGPASTSTRTVANLLTAKEAGYEDGATGKAENSPAIRAPDTPSELSHLACV